MLEAAFRALPHEWFVRMPSGCLLACLQRTGCVWNALSDDTATRLLTAFVGYIESRYVSCRLGVSSQRQQVACSRGKLHSPCPTVPAHACWRSAAPRVHAHALVVQPAARYMAAVHGRSTWPPVRRAALTLNTELPCALCLVPAPAPVQDGSMLPKIMPWLWRLADEQHNTFQARAQPCANAWQAHANGYITCMCLGCRRRAAHGLEWQGRIRRRSPSSMHGPLKPL